MPVAWIYTGYETRYFFPTILEIEKNVAKLTFDDPMIHFHNYGRTSSK